MKTALLSIPKYVWLIALSLFTSHAHAQLAVWNYEPLQGTLTAPAPNTGTGTSSIVSLGDGSIATLTRTGMAGSGCGAQNGATAWAFEPFNPGTINERMGAQFNTSTAQYQDIVVTWDQRWSNTAPNTVRLQYTTDGTTWTNFNMTGGNTTFCNGSINANGCFEANTTAEQYRRIRVDFSAVTAVDNKANFGVRILAAHYQSTGQYRQNTSPGSVAGTGGTWRFDNVTITGTPMPGPNPSVMSGTAPTCVGTPVNIRVAITGGTSPYTLVYTDGTSNFTVNNYVSNTSIAVNPATTRTYNIVSVTDANGLIGTGNSGSALITVNALPAVTATNIMSCSTGAVTLTGGNPAGGTYSIPNPYTGPTTTFNYTYTNANGCTRTSATYTFMRNTAPSITTQPSTAAQTVCQSGTFNPIAIVASGSATLSYQWYSNTTASTIGGTPLTATAHLNNGSRSASYTPLSTTLGTLYYYVVVTNICTSIKSANTSGAFTVVPATVTGTVNSGQIVCAGNIATDLTLTGNTGNIVKWQKATDAGFTTGVQDIAHTTAILPGANIGAVLQTTYVRAFVQNGSCLELPTAPVEILIKSTTWNGAWTNGDPDASVTAIFATDYHSSGDLEACSAIVTAGNVVIDTGHTLKLQNGLVVSGGTMTFENNASLVQVNDAVNSGSIIYKRNTTPMLKYDYTYWSSPVYMQILASLSPLTLSDKYFWWNPAIYNWSNIAAPGITPMEIGKGYIIRAPQNFDPTETDIFEAAFIGRPNNGDYTVPIVVSGADDLNLIGNPYPSAVSADAFLSDPDNAAALGTGTSIYFWTHNSPILNYEYAANDYATYNYAGGTGTAPALAPGLNTSRPDGFIAAGQSFMIKGLATGTATFKNNMRNGNNSQFFRMDPVQKDRLWLEFKNNNGAYKQLLVGYIENATDGFDRGYDAEWIEGENPIGFYSLLDSTKLTIQGKALPFDSSDTIALGYRCNRAGEFQIGLSDFDAFFDGQDVYLEDLQLGIIHNLKNGAYEFFTQNGTSDTRFVLRFETDALGVTMPESVQNGLVVYTEGDLINIHSSTPLKSVTLFDVTGRKLLARNADNATKLSIDKPVAEQMLLVQATTSQNQTITRKIMH